jgi:ATP-dependent Lhr-like helicase
VDRLREAPRTPGPRAESIAVIAAVDPACAWGSVLPWPQLRDPAARPARRVGATAILADGELAVWVEPRGKRIATGALPAETIELALTVGLPRIAARSRRRELLVESIDGVAAPESPLARALLAAGARVDYRGLVIRAPVPGVAPLGAPATAGAPPNRAGAPALAGALAQRAGADIGEADGDDEADPDEEDEVDVDPDA